MEITVYTVCTVEDFVNTLLKQDYRIFVILLHVMASKETTAHSGGCMLKNNMYKNVKPTCKKMFTHLYHFNVYVSIIFVN